MLSTGKTGYENLSSVTSKYLDFARAKKLPQRVHRRRRRTAQHTSTRVELHQNKGDPDAGFLLN